ncbi:general transcription factor II-I repeat domain-containing protein 2-like [Colletes gigas]|uniref:general transcription factor II-I repeat domain-containing protein 2-like n=1 Tax=Colletes gigas TaxID=935657 RepID=UPI001C9B9CCC|nr:general transcription factor II-I repeat domain-containing protein 2-like [Colletes gigas]XP_043259020.1 general transcription factor II-I repeat domain-containing protein 2-like [Colletes gigas]
MAETSMLKRHSVGSVIHFNPSWEKAYFFTEHDHNVRCLVCLKSLNHVKKYNLQRHYNTFHAKQYSRFTGDERLAEIVRLKSKLMDAKEDVLSAVDNNPTDEAALRASYRIALEIAKSSCCFLNDDFVKHCLLSVVEEMCPELVYKFECIGMSDDTITRRIYEMANNVTEQLSNIIQTFIAYSIAVDESTDVSDGPLLAIFIRGVDKNLTVTEELLDIFSVKKNTSGEDVFLCVEEVMEQNNLQWDKLVSVATGGAPAMARRHNGFVARLRIKLQNLAIPHEVIAIRHSVDPQNLCSKRVHLDDVMLLIVRTMNYIRYHGATHRDLIMFLEELDAEYGELPYHTEVHWISRGRILNRFFELREEIRVFMDMIEQPVLELHDESWVIDLAFLSDVVDHLNILNASWQEKGNSIMKYAHDVSMFRIQLDFWIELLYFGRVPDFTKLNTITSLNLERHKTILQNLLRDFETKCEDTVKLMDELNIIESPFNIRVVISDPQLQLELLDLKCDRALKDKFQQKHNLLDFYNNLNQCRFPQLHKCAARIITMFSSTYICKQLSSVLTQTKSINKAGISNHKFFKSRLILNMAQSIVPNITELVDREKESRMPN